MEYPFYACKTSSENNSPTFIPVYNFSSFCECCGTKPGDAIRGLIASNVVCRPVLYDPDTLVRWPNEIIFRREATAVDISIFMHCFLNVRKIPNIIGLIVSYNPYREHTFYNIEHAIVMFPYSIGNFGIRYYHKSQLGEIFVGPFDNYDLVMQNEVKDLLDKKIYSSIYLNHSHRYRYICVNKLPEYDGKLSYGKLLMTFKNNLDKIF